MVPDIHRGHQHALPPSFPYYLHPQLLYIPVHRGPTSSCRHGLIFRRHEPENILNSIEAVKLVYGKSCRGCKLTEKCITLT